jgi:isoleucyl-tRNA synthetase
MFKSVDPKQSLPKMEEEILKFWDEEKIFEKSVEKNPVDKSFIFYEGPPTANGMPGLHHVLARAFKDIIPRYKTMKGLRVERKAGWDTHGLPVEIQVEKELGLKSKQEIENIVPGNVEESIAEFNKKCKESVWKYKDLWEKMTRRMAYWVDMNHPYVTYENKYIESVWWQFAQIWKTKGQDGKSLVYRGSKVIPYCYRCGTGLSSHEVAQGYQTVKDNSVYLKFKAEKDGKIITDDSTYFLVWTTTPWTLPGNVALAVGKGIDYVKAKVDGESFILAEERITAVEGDFEIQGKMKGQDLLGLSYKPLFKTTEDEKAYKIVGGDFVSTEDGTGIVHIAPAFGEDDASVARENNLPTVLTVDEDGRVTADVPGKGIPVKKKNDKNRYEVDEQIAKNLKKRNLFFREEVYEHEYPHCWRCDMPLIYRAKPSWFIRMSELKKNLVKNNEKINWVPSHIKKGRFGEWLENVKDWAISRERYWGTPLPIWICEKCGLEKAVESAKELEINLGDFYVMRHGEARSNVERILSCKSGDGMLLTEKGKKDVQEIADKLKKEKIDLIISSDIDRTKQTAEIIAKELNIKIIFDKRARETNVGDYDLRKMSEIEDFEDKWEKGINMKFPNGDDWLSLGERAREFYNELFSKYRNKKVLVVSHGDVLTALEASISGKNYLQEIKRIHADSYIEKGELRELKYKIADLHKPFIDELELDCECGGKMRRTPEVMDVWFDSGAMPLAQWSYPNAATDEDKERIESGKLFPADYISEAIDQTRGWFYTLHAIATVLNLDKKVPTGQAFKNVICLGHILDAKGKKMSKSRGNVIEPMEVMEKFGADALRWMLFSINQPGLPKRFDLKGMNDVSNRVFRMLWNSYYFFVMYANIDKFEPKTQSPEFGNNLLDKWIVSETNSLIKEVDAKLRKYDIYAPTKLIENFIDNLSNWYIRRSRKRFWKSESDEDKLEAYETLHYVLTELSKLMAPFTPFVSEEIYKNITNQDSVHLVDFPVADENLIDGELNEQMQVVRRFVKLGLAARAKAGIKVRQPLSELRVNQSLDEELVNLVKEEVNVKRVAFVGSVEQEPGVYTEEEGNLMVGLDIAISEDLRLEGEARELIRRIQELRKKAGYDVDNRITLCYQGGSQIFEKFGDIIAKETLSEGAFEADNPEHDISDFIDLETAPVKVWLKKI